MSGTPPTDGEERTIAVDGAQGTAGAPAIWLGGRVWGLVLIAALVVLRWTSDPPPIETLRLLTFDSYQKFSPREAIPGNVIIIDIDEESIQTFGQWPWPRWLLADLIERIAAHGPFAIGLDIVFAENDRISPGNLHHYFPNLDEATRAFLAELPSTDQRFAEALAANPVILGMVRLQETLATTADQKVEELPFNVIKADPKPFVPEVTDLLSNIPILQDAAAGWGLLDYFPDDDGVVRRVPSVIKAQGRLHPSLVMAMLWLATGRKPIAINADERGIRALQVGDFAIPTTEKGELWLHYSPHDPSRYIPAKSVLLGEPLDEALAAPLVLIGTSAAALDDLRSTPIDPRMPGVEVHAQLLESVLVGGLLRRPAAVEAAEIVVMVLCGLVLVLLVPRVNPAVGAVALIVIVLSVYGLGLALFSERHLLFDASYPAILAILVFLTMSALTLAEANRRRAALQAALQLEKVTAARMAGELDAARKIQMQMLPQSEDSFPGETRFTLDALIDPARETGGDFYDFFMIDDRRLFLIVGDVTDKGLESSIFMVLSKALYKSIVLRRLEHIDEIMQEANQALLRENQGRFGVTAFAAILDVETGELQFSNAGHDAPYVIGKGRELFRLANVGGPPLCFLDDYPYEKEVMRLNEGESLLAFTDGVSEAESPEGELFGFDRIASILEAPRKSDGPQEIIQALYQAVQAFSDSAERSDDITLLAVRLSGPPSSPAVD